MGRFSRCPYLSSVAVAFVAVTMPSFSVTPISVTVTLSTRRPVTIPAKRTEPRDAHIKGQNRKNVGDFTTFHNLTFRDVLEIFPDLCPSVCASLDPVFCLLRYCHTRYRHQDSRCLVCRVRLGNLRRLEIQVGTRDPFLVPRACREEDPSLGGTVGWDLQVTITAVLGVEITILTQEPIVL